MRNPGMKHAVVADIERDLIVERTPAGLARAKAEGETLGRPPKTTPEQRRAMVDADSRKQSVIPLARLYGVSTATVLSTVNANADNDEVGSNNGL